MRQPLDANSPLVLDFPVPGGASLGTQSNCRAKKLLKLRHASGAQKYIEVKEKWLVAGALREALKQISSLPDHRLTKGIKKAARAGNSSRKRLFKKLNHTGIVQIVFRAELNFFDFGPEVGRRTPFLNLRLWSFLTTCK